MSSGLNVLFRAAQRAHAAGTRRSLTVTMAGSVPCRTANPAAPTEISPQQRELEPRRGAGGEFTGVSDKRWIRLGI